MRTSHTAIRRMIADAKHKLTPEQVFSSRQFAAYLTDIAEATTGRYRRKSKVKTYWDTSEDAEIAYTNNRTITINTGNFLTGSFPTKQLMADSLLGITGHECGHILYTDFKMIETYNQALTGGRFYPRIPEDLTSKQEKSLKEILKAFDDKDAAVIHAIAEVTHSLVNALEDVYIEARICDAFPGSFKTGILLNNLRFAELMDSVQEQINQKHHEVFIIVNLLIQYAKTGDVNNLSGYKGPYMDTLYDCIPFVDNAVYDDDSKVRFDAANQMLLYLFPYMKSFIERIREDLKNGTDKAKDDVKKQMAGGSLLPADSTKPAPGTGKYKHCPDKDDEEIAHIQEVVEYESGRLELEKTDDINEGDSGGISKDSSYAGAGYVSQAAADMERIMTALAEDAAYAQYEEDLSEELQKEANSIRYGNAHRGIHVNINRMLHVKSHYMEMYRKVTPPLLLISKRLQKQVTQALKDYKEGGKLDGLPFGKRINVRNAYHNDGKIFYKLRLPTETDIAVAILVDESGSMGCADRITHARSASIILHDFCKGLDIPIAIYGHTEEHNVELYAYAEFESIDNKDHYRLMDMSARGGNRDGAALRFVAERLMTRPEQIKLLIIISDGQPAAQGYYGTAAEADLRGIKQEYSRKGIRFFAAAIGDDKENIQRIYKDGFLDITNLAQLPVNLGRLLIQYIKNTTV